MTTFGLSSTVFRGRVPGARDFERAVAHGFTALELVAAAGHFDVASASDVAELRAGATAAGISILAITAEPAAARSALEAATVLDCPLVVIRTQACAGLKLSAAAADSGVLKKLVEDLGPAPDAGLRIAVDFPAWRSFSAEDLVEFLEEAAMPWLGATLDAGHANLGGSAVDAAEALSGFLTLVRLHDNHGRDDSHRLPGAGTIEWPAVITSCWKADFTGPWILAPTASGEGSAEEVLHRAVGARTRLQAILEDLAQPFTFTE